MTRTVLVTLVVTVCLALLLPSASAMAAPGDLDRSFGGDGIVEPKRGGRMALGPRGEVFLLTDNYEFAQSRRSFLIEHLLANGSGDRGFGAQGTATVSTPVMSSRVSFMVDSKGRVMLAVGDGPRLILTRLTASGTPDGSFGGDGIVELTMPSEDWSPEAIAVDGRGRVVVALIISSSSPDGRTIGPAIGMLRLLADGSADQGFNNGAPVARGLPGGGYFEATALRPGRGFVALVRGASSRSPLFPYAISAGGILDRHLGSRLRLPPSLGRGDLEEISELLLRPNGKIVLIGDVFGFRTKRPGFALGLRANGRIDRSFGDRGVSRLPWGTGPAALDARGRIVGVGERTSDGEVIYRLRANGLIDRTFAGGNGVPIHMVGTKYVDVPSTQRPTVFADGYPGCRSACDLEPSLARVRGGSSRVRCLGRRATIVGTRRGEVLHGTARRDVIAGLGGDDTIHGLGGDDLLCGGSGSDVTKGGPGKDRRR